MTAPIEEERLVAYADGELDQAEAREVEALVAADPALAETVSALRADAATIRAAYQEPLREPVPERLVAALDAAFAARRAAPSQAPAQAYRRHPMVAAIAASIVAAVVGLSSAYYFAERGVEREIARLEAVRAADQRMIQAAISLALETHVSGAPAEWYNPDSGSRGRVEPVRTFKISTGQWCREYVHRLEFRGWRELRETRRAIACRGADGVWKMRLQLGEES